jgi:hypothetical protein
MNSRIASALVFVIVLSAKAFAVTKCIGQLRARHPLLSIGVAQKQRTSFPTTSPGHNPNK